MTTTVLNERSSEVENKIPDASSLVTTTVFNTEISKVENKSLGNVKYITTQEFNKLTAANFTSRSTQVSKTDFDNNLINFNRKINSRKTNYLEVLKKLNSLRTKAYDFFLGRRCFTSNLKTWILKPIYLPTKT